MPLTDIKQLDPLCVKEKQPSRDPKTLSENTHHKREGSKWVN